MYTQCFITLICYEWAYGSTLTLLCPCLLGMDFQEIGVDLSPSDVAMPWLRLQTPIDCISHPYWMYTKCFCTLIWCEWAYGSTLILLCLCRLGEDFGGYWGRPQSEWHCNVMVEAQTLWNAFHIHMICIQSILIPWYAMNEQMGPPSNCNACAGLGRFFGDIGVDLSLSDVAISRLRLQTCLECNPHPYWMM